jgi:hypothetical protein
MTVSSPCTNHCLDHHPKIPLSPSRYYLTPHIHKFIRSYTCCMAYGADLCHVRPLRARTRRPPLTDRYATYADKPRSPCPIPTVNTTTPPTSSPLPNSFVHGRPPLALSLYPSLKPVDTPLRFFISVIYHLTRLNHLTLALTRSYLIINPSALLFPSPSPLITHCPP